MWSVFLGRTKGKRLSYFTFKQAEYDIRLIKKPINNIFSRIEVKRLTQQTQKRHMSVLNATFQLRRFVFRLFQKVDKSQRRVVLFDWIL